MKATVAERVAAGAAFLDEHRPGWEKNVDLRQLDMSHFCLCVLGQQNGTYSDVAHELGLNPEGLRPIQLGFLGRSFHDGERLDEDYAALDAAWRELIEARR